MKRKWIVGIIIFLILVIIGLLLYKFLASPPKNAQEIASDTPVNSFEDPNWWDHAVFYEIFVRSFSDSNGDGIGDFNGITEKLDYLNDGDPNTTTDLGINAIWLLPIYSSPSYHGYDVTDYFTVNPQYGTMEDFKRLLSESHKRGIHVIIDFVINHTSVEHPWFNESQNPASLYHDWYIWKDENPGYMGPWGEEVWHQAANGLYYYGVFWSGMPDLNLQNPDVAKQIESAASFWINDVGVDGFRIDGAKHLIEDGTIQANSAATVQWLKGFKSKYKAWNPAAMAVGEVWDSTSTTTIYLKADALDMVFDFDLAGNIISSVNNASGSTLGSKLSDEVNQYPNGGMGIFLTNHDMDRVMSQLGGDVKKAKHAATILLTSPGTPFLYYGEEIGMVGVKPDEQIRTPMQWNGETGAGFTMGSPWEAINPDYNIKNVAQQSQDPDSLLSLYRSLIQIRMKHPALLDGSFIRVEVADPSVFSGLRISENEMILTIINFKDTPIDTLALSSTKLQPGKYKLVALFGSGELEMSIDVTDVGGKRVMTLPFTIEPQANEVYQLLPIQ